MNSRIGPKLNRKVAQPLEGSVVRPEAELKTRPSSTGTSWSLNRRNSAPVSKVRSLASPAASISA